MARRFINQLGHQESVDQVFMASGKQLRPNRNGNLYLQVDLTDKTGCVSARMWNCDDADFRGFEDGDFVRVEGMAQVYQGSMQLIATSIYKARQDEIDFDDFMSLSTADIDRMALRMTELLRSVVDPNLRNLAECFLSDDSFMRRFTRAPAGVKNHHAYPGGLLEHVLNLMEVANLIAPRYPALDRDLLIMGVLLHDMGKIEELSYDKSFSYTDEGQLIGHTVMAVTMLDTKIREVEQLTEEEFPTETALRLKHMIVSHHGEYQYGAPRLPMTLEAVALHHLDNLDAKLFSFEQLMRDDANIDSPWTAYHQNINRKLYKGYATQPTESAPR